MEKTRTQRGEVLRYLKSHKKGITSRQAFELFGCTRLASHICEFRKKGMDIETVDEIAKDRYGANCHYARYIYHG